MMKNRASPKRQTTMGTQASTKYQHNTKYHRQEIKYICWIDIDSCNNGDMMQLPYNVHINSNNVLKWVSCNKYPVFELRACGALWTFEKHDLGVLVSISYLRKW